jgi:tetratricopeptide (TPR) repeat protein
MSISHYHSGGFVASGRCLILIGVLLIASSSRSAGQTDSSQAAKGSTVEAHFAAAQRAQKNKDYVTAEREYRALLAIKPDFAEVHMNLGLVYQLQDHISEAMTEFRRALKLKPTLIGANFLLGVDYCKLGEGTRAIPFLQSAVRQEPGRTDIWSWLATAQEMSGEIRAEEQTLQEALSLQPQDVDLLYLLGHAYERLGKEEVRRLQESAPGSVRAEQLLAESYAATTEWPTAVMHFQNALAASPNTPGVHVELGEALLQAGKLKAASREFREELRLYPGSLRAILRAGEAKLLLGDVEGALQDFAEAIDTDKSQAEIILGIREQGFRDAGFQLLPDDEREKAQQLAPDLRRRNVPAAHFALAFLAAQNGDSSAAAAESADAISSLANSRSASSCSEAEVRESLKQGYLSTATSCGTKVLTPQSSGAFRIIVASALLEAGDYEVSLKVLSELAPGDRHSPEASYWRARCYEKLATAAYLNLSHVDPNSYRMHQLLGDLDAAKGDDVKSVEEYRSALALKPSLPNLHYSLGHALWKDLKVKEAREEFEAELKLNPRHPGALNELADTYLLEHQPDKALPYLTRALAVDPSGHDIHRDLGRAYSEMRDYLKAETQFKIALSSDHDGSIHYELARVYQALGEKEKAAREFELSTTLNRETHNKLERQTERLADAEKSAQDP